MGSRLRSSSGCWTCRLRRKKCDETKPHCRRCTKLQLDCDGCTERPVWMDGGKLEKLKLEQTKRLVRESMGLGSKRRRKSMGNQNFSEDSISNSLGAVITQLSSTLRTGEEAGIENGLWNLYPFSNNEDGFEDSFQFDEVDIGNCLSFPGHKTYGSDKTQDCTLSRQQISPSSEVPFVDSYDVPYPHEGLYDSLIGPPYPKASSSDSSSEFSGSGNQARLSNHPSTPEEAGLLLYYLEYVSERQLLMVTKANRGWLYMAITRTDMAYWATLSLASYYQDSESLCHFYNNLATLELRKNILRIELKQPKSLEMILDCCFSMIQLIFLEKLRGNLEAYQMHIHAACNLLTNFQRVATVDGTSKMAMITSDLDVVNSAMLSLVVTTLRWFDVVLSCSLRTLPSISAQLPSLLQLQSKSDPTQMANNITYQGRVTASLLEVLEHDHWKITLTQAGRLSVVELVQRAAAIESNMLSDRKIIETEAGCQKSSNSERANSETMLCQVANIFTSTTRVYLHVIVSGPHREVPEIRKGVSHTVGLFRELLGTGLLAHVAWPFCFIGCLATGGDREFVASLMIEVLSQIDCPLNIKRAIIIIKECWRLLDEEIMIDPDWVSAMDSLEFQFILF